MEGALDLSSLLRLLSQAERQVGQLMAQVHADGNQYRRTALLQQIRSCLQDAIATAKIMEPEPSNLPPQLPLSDSPPISNSGSPRSECSERVLFKEHERREMCKKRKTLSKWASRVCVAGGGLAEGLEDGYSWRKYGQKGILGARHPRGYYRCTHRNTAGCLATKQVQRSDDDSCVFDITYRGDHTCQQKLQAPPTPGADEPATSQSHDQHQAQVLNSSFFFPSSSAQITSFPPQNLVFSSTAAVEDHLHNYYTGSSTPLFISPATSDSNYFPVAPSQVAVHPNASESELTEIVSAAASTTNSPRMDANFMLDQAEFGPLFNFDPSNFFGSSF
ncbi:transcription factor WRKY19-like [Zingiber officinale]|uniref:WRKY domain-containing protein n=1 Tax=Zingiber officinale TaxID=94328 RepID=A0A8J5HTN1_ZINOF|nr:transcription factor WRKY19-like [Zingiber officinale]KAG6530325.1 hypothetical protein ZIOFF_012552 [Zingiber officinale]